MAIVCALAELEYDMPIRISITHNVCK
jgi:hypothetical protein